MNGDNTPQPLMIVLGRHRPHEVLFLVFSVIWGIAYLIGTPPPPSMYAVMDAWVVRTWSIGLLLSGLVGIMAIVIARRNIEQALQLEQAAMFIGTAALIVFAAAVWTYAGMAGTFVGGFAVAWAGANVWRAVQIFHDLAGMAKRRKP